MNHSKYSRLLLKSIKDKPLNLRDTAESYEMKTELSVKTCDYGDHEITGTVMWKE